MVQTMKITYPGLSTIELESLTIAVSELDTPALEYRLRGIEKDRASPALQHLPYTMARLDAEETAIRDELQRRAEEGRLS